jgi:peptidyl-prolyl cis-trans isomerase D
MFITHGERLRKHAKWIMAGILVVLVPSFIAMFTMTGNSTRETDLPKINGKPVNATEYNTAYNSVLAQYVVSAGKEPPRTQEFRDNSKQEAVIRLVLLRKAKQMGISVPDNELLQEIRNQPYFLNEAKQFDPERYQRFIIFLNGFGISEPQFEQIMREQLTMAHLELVIGSAVKVTPQEIDLTYQPLHERVWIDLVDFDADSNNAPVTVTEDEARTFFDRNKESYRTPKQVRVRYAYFAISNTEAAVKLTDADVADFYERSKDKYAGTNGVAPLLDTVKNTVKADLLKMRADRLAQDRATELTVKLVQEPGQAAPDFAKLCAAAGVVPVETAFFSLSGKVPGIDQSGTAFNQAAFALAPDALYSDPVAGERGYYVLDYLASKPSEIPAFDEVKAAVIDELKREKLYDLTVKQAQDDAAKVKKAVAAGKTFAAACHELGLTIQSRGPITLSDEKSDLPAAGHIPQAALSMETNTVSEFIPTANGGLFFCLKTRKPADSFEEESDRPKFAQQILQRDRQAVFNAWVSEVVHREGVDFGSLPSHEQPPPDSGETPENGSAPAPAGTPGTSPVPGAS